MIATPRTREPTRPTRPGDQEVDYVEQCSSDLTFYLFAHPAPREVVRVLAERVLPLVGGQVTLAIIGSSHFLEIRAGETLLCELLSCPRPGLEEWLAMSGEYAQKGGGAAARSAWGYRVRQGDVSYRFGRWRREYSAHRFRAETARLAAPRARRLGFSFPEGEGPASAATSLEWWVEGRRAVVDTHHTYPGELAIVRTRSVIEVAETGASS